MTTLSPLEKKTRAKQLLALMASKAVGMPTPTGLQHYVPRPTDITIATYPKAGTTLLQNMTYQIVVATGGAPPFDSDGTQFTDICQVVPWLEYGPEFGVCECPSSPRVFKTHESSGSFDLNKSKFIFCVRNPLDFPSSRLDFIFDVCTGGKENDVQVREQVFHECVRQCFSVPPSEAIAKDSNGVGESVSKKYGPWFEHTKSWTENPHQNVLILFYEDVKKDLAGTAQKIARFMGRSLSEPALQTVVERCDRKRMGEDTRFTSAITAKGLGFGDAMLRTVLPENREGFKQFAIEDSSMNLYKDRMLNTFGVASYEEFCDRVHAKEDVCSSRKSLH